MDTKLAHKAIKSARLAASEARLGNDEAAAHAATTAGNLAAKAGMTLNELHAEVPSLHDAAVALAWNCIVDGWYEAQPKDATESEITTLLNALADRPNHHDIASRMVAELYRRRGL